MTDLQPVRIVSTIALVVAGTTTVAVTVDTGHLPLVLVGLVDVLVLAHCSLRTYTRVPR